MVARIQGHKNPFSPELLALNEAQLDFILEMESIDHPDELTFRRGGEEPISNVRAAWNDVLRGKARLDYYGDSLVAALRRVAKMKANKPRLGIVRGKKPNAGNPVNRQAK